jgi:DNA (cytosine-5)-methyltransferase 1
LDVGELDVLDGSPPCQGFSTAGKRQLDDPRNQLFREYVRLLRGLKPKVFVMENVSGMVKGVMKLVFVEILRELKASGYKVSAKLLNAMYFNVPQSRQRMIFVGVREDLGIEPSHPEAESVPVTVKEAIGKVLFSKKDLHDIELTPLYKEYWYKAGQGGVVGKLNQNRRMSENLPCKTLQKGEGNGGAYHPTECRSFSERELARMASFPDGFIFIGGRKNSKNRIGNSVPPLFMRSIANHVRTEILDKAIK